MLKQGVAMSLYFVEDLKENFVQSQNWSRTFRARFHQCSTYSFYARRSQKRKKILMTWLSSYAFGISTSAKAVRRTLVKLTPGYDNNDDDYSKFKKFCNPRLSSHFWKWCLRHSFRAKLFLGITRLLLWLKSTLLPKNRMHCTAIYMKT